MERIAALEREVAELKGHVQWARAEAAGLYGRVGAIHIEVGQDTFVGQILRMGFDPKRGWLFVVSK